MILLDKDLDAKQKYNMIADIEKVDRCKQDTWSGKYHRTGISGEYDPGGCERNPGE